MPQVERVADLAKEPKWHRRQRPEWAAWRTTAIEQGSGAECGE